MGFDFGTFLRAATTGGAQYLRGQVEAADRERQRTIEDEERARRAAEDAIRLKLLGRQLNPPKDPNAELNTELLKARIEAERALAAQRNRPPVTSSSKPMIRNIDGVPHEQQPDGTWAPVQTTGAAPSRDTRSEAVRAALLDAISGQRTKGAGGMIGTKYEVPKGDVGGPSMLDQPRLGDEGQAALREIARMNELRRELRARYPTASPNDLEAMLRRMIAEEGGR